MRFVGLDAREPRNLWLIIFNGTVYLVVIGYNAGGNARESGIMMVCVLDVGGKCLQNVHQSDKMMGHG